MNQNEVASLARITWYAGVIALLLALIIGNNYLLICAGLAISGGIVSMAIVTRSSL